MEQGGVLGEAGRFPGKPPRRSGHRHECSAPTFCRYQPLVAAGESRGSISPLGLSVAQMCSAEATGEPEAAVPIPLSLIQTLCLSGLFKKNPKSHRLNAALI